MNVQAENSAGRVGLLARWRNFWWARRVPVRDVVSMPAPMFPGSYALGQRMLSGRFLLEGTVIEAASGIPFPDNGQDALNGFVWLDDLAAVGDSRARKMAQSAVADWIARVGSSPRWTLRLTGRRVLRWLGHASFLLQDMPAPARADFLRSLSMQVAWLEARADRTAQGLTAVEVQAALLHAALTLDGLEGRAGAASAALLAAARSVVGQDGTMASRESEDLLTVFEQLALAAQALADRDRPIPSGLLHLLDQIAAVLRCLRHADGGLARFQGGGRGREGMLGAALAIQSRLGVVATRPGSDMAMGFARLSAGRSTVIIDAAAPPLAAAPAHAHASTLAFELTSNRRPVIVSCGDGRHFGAEWHRASRATALHSTLAIDGNSSTRFITQAKGEVTLADGPRHVHAEFRNAARARAVFTSHDGYAASHGLEHQRYLALSSDGRQLEGEDSLVAATPAQQRRLDAVLAGSGQQGIPFALRFHLHPDARPDLQADGSVVTIALRSGERWEFRADGHLLELAPSVYLEKGRPTPRPSQQIVLSSRAADYTTQINWRLAMAADMPTALRDTAQDNPMAVPPL